MRLVRSPVAAKAVKLLFKELVHELVYSKIPLEWIKCRGTILQVAGFGANACKDPVKIEKEKRELVDNRERGRKIFNLSKLAIIAICKL